MRQIRTSGSEGGEAAIKAVFPTPIYAPVARRVPGTPNPAITESGRESGHRLAKREQAADNTLGFLGRERYTHASLPCNCPRIFHLEC